MYFSMIDTFTLHKWLSSSEVTELFGNPAVVVTAHDEVKWMKTQENAKEETSKDHHCESEI